MKAGVKLLIAIIKLLTLIRLNLLQSTNQNNQKIQLNKENKDAAVKRQDVLNYTANVWPIIGRALANVTALIVATNKIIKKDLI